MTEKEVLDGNVLIAEFMEYPEGYPHITDEFGYDQTVEGYRINGEDISTEDLQYHSSWNSLMPVVEKISKMENVYYFSILPEHSSDIFLTGIPIEDLSNLFSPIEEFGSNIEMVFNTVIGFIKWQNEKTEN